MSKKLYEWMAAENLALEVKPILGPKKHWEAKLLYPSGAILFALRGATIEKAVDALIARMALKAPRCYVPLKPIKRPR
jgi:hypothetical protein